MAERLYKTKRTLGEPMLSKTAWNHHRYFTNRLKLFALGDAWKELSEHNPLEGHFKDESDPFHLERQHLASGDVSVVFSHAIGLLADKAGAGSYSVRLLQAALASQFRDKDADPRTASPAWPLLRAESLSARAWLSFVMPKGEATAFVVQTLRDKKIRASATTLDNWQAAMTERYEKHMLNYSLKPDAKIRETPPNNWPAQYQYSPRLAGDMAWLSHTHIRNGEAMIAATPDRIGISDMTIIGVIQRRQTFADEYAAGEWLVWHDKTVKDTVVAKAWKRYAAAIIDPVAEIVAKS